jgi:hypothetical protein
MKLPKKRWIVLTLIIAFILFTVGGRRIDIALTCPLCLQSGDRVEKDLFGIPYYRHQSLRRYPGGIDTPFGVGPRSGYVDPKLYEEIFGHPCTHEFKKGGFCRSTYGLVGCGAYGEGSRLRVRNEVAVEIFHAYSRVHDKAIARKTFDLIESLQPINSTLPPDPKFYFLRHNLALVGTVKEWEQVLADAQDDESSTGLVVRDIPVLKERLTSGDLHLQLAVIEALAELNTPESWKALAPALNEPQLAGRVNEMIRQNHPLSLYPAFVKYCANGVKFQDRPVWPFLNDPRQSFDKRFSDDELRTFLRLRDPYVDCVCLGTIWKEYRFELLDEVMDALDDRPSAAAKVAAEQLLIGPPILSGLTPEHIDGLSPEERARRNRDPWITIANGGQMESAQAEVVKLGREAKPENWDAIQKHWETHFARSGEESIAAAFAQAMYQCDPQRTCEWLAAQFPVKIGSHRFRCVLASMGAVGDRSLLPALESFSASNPWSIQNQYWRPYLDYALHRCRRIQDWKLVQDSMGHYHIEKPAHP